MNRNRSFLKIVLTKLVFVPSILLAADTDRDGLDDAVETNTGVYVSPFDTGTAPNNPDSDGDGVGDWYEVVNMDVPPGDPQPNSPNDPNLHLNTPYPLPAPDSSPTLATRPVKVYILSGQSNMDGHGLVSETNSPGTLTDIVLNGKKYPNLWNGSTWASRSDVYCRGLVATSGNGPLVPGFGSSGARFGPEFGFGQQMGFYHDEPVLIIKVSQGNRTLGYDFLPPGSTQYTSGSKTYAGYGDSPQSWTTGTTPSPGSNYAGHQWDQSFLDDSDWHTPPGTPYTNGIDILDNFATLYPQWASQGFEIAGFVWWQGYSDALSSVPYASRYEENMVRFIKELRDYYEARYPGNISASAPFVLGTLGFNGWSQSGVQLETTQGQLAVDGAAGNYPEFANNVKTAETRGFYRNGSISPRTGQGHHYHLNAETYLLAGDALGRAMIDLQELTSASDTAQPQVAYLSPVDDATDAPGNMNLKITFNETVVIGSGNITVKNLTDNTQTVISVTDAGQVSAAGFALTINPAADLETGDDYAILIDPGAVVDGSGNVFEGISGDTSWNFTVSAPDETAPPVPSFITPLGPKRNDEITVSVNAVSDPEGNGVVYRFRNVTLGRDSGWTVNPTWIDNDLPKGKIFAYTVQSRDNSLNLNESTVSAPVAAKTLSTNDPQVQVADVFTYREDFRPTDLVGDSQGVTGPITIPTTGFGVGGTAKLVGVLSMHNSAATVATLTALTFNGVNVFPNVITGFGSPGEVASEQYIFYLDNPPAAGDLVIGFSTSGGVDEVGVALFALNKVRSGYFARGENGSGNPPELDVYSGDFVVGVGKRNNQSQSVSNAPPYASLNITAGNLAGFVGYRATTSDGPTAPVFSNTSISSSVAAFEAAPDPEPPLSAYETWALSQAPVTANTPDADEDGDGVNNGIEFVLGGTSSGNDTGKLPALSSDGSSAVFAFTRAQQSIGSGITTQIEVGTSLAAWPDVYPVPDSATPGPPVTVVKDSSPGFDTVTLSIPMAPDACKFARLKVEVTP